MTELSNDKKKYIVDYISGEKVRNTPEETEAVQVLAKQLVENFNYDKEQIQTHPQYRVKASPSDTSKKYPVDIAVFKTAAKKDEDVQIVAECKSKTKKEGERQLKDYLRFCEARVGVWFNGEEKLYLKKIEKNGKVLFDTIPTLPKKGQKLEEIGKFKRKDLVTPHNLKNIFTVIKNYLAGNAVGTTRDEALAQQIINLVFCKIYDEKFTFMENMVSFRASINDSPEEVKERILLLFKKVKAKYKEVINVGDEIRLDANSIVYVVGELQNYCLLGAERDAIAEAFEIFIGPSLKGSQGQFFTPRNVIQLLVELIDPKIDDYVIDPACGTGGFLLESLKHMWKKLDSQAKESDWPSRALQEDKTAIAVHQIRGIEKDNFLSKVAKAYMTIMGDGKGGIFCEDSLERPVEWKDKTCQNITANTFDVLLTNPPFGKDIKIIGENKLKQFDLGYSWQMKQGVPYKTNKLKNKENPYVLFIERSLELLKDGGRMGIVLPEIVFHGTNSKYIMNYICNNNNIEWIVDLPRNTFQPHTGAKCIAIIFEKNVSQQEKIKMAVAEEVGHDHRGKKKYRWDNETNTINKNELWDDIPLIIEEAKSKTFKKYCFEQNSKACKDTEIFVPRFYWDDKVEEVREEANNNGMHLVSVDELIEEGAISHYFNGHGSPKAHFKGKGDIPYVRVKDIINWEVYRDPTAMVPQRVYEAFKDKGIKNKYLQTGDILFVWRGSKRIGSVAMVAPYDQKVILTREILTLRTTREENKYNLNPYYLIYLLEHELTKKQFYNKILVDTTIDNMDDRWKTLMLPFHNDKKVIDEISLKVKNVFEQMWQARETILDFKNNIEDLFKL
ncbi:MAG: N-6 DNA methylase [Candidatus Woesearchaeota archaeon]